METLETNKFKSKLSALLLSEGYMNGNDFAVLSMCYVVPFSVSHFFYSIRIRTTLSLFDASAKRTA